MTKSSIKSFKSIQKNYRLDAAPFKSKIKKSGH